MPCSSLTRLANMRQATASCSCSQASRKPASRPADDFAQRMHPYAGCGVGQSRAFVRVVERLLDHERLAPEIRDEPAGSPVWRRLRIVEHEWGGMRFREIEETARSQEMRDDPGPAPDVRQPAERAP